jgi:hypothetical protein
MLESLGVMPCPVEPPSFWELGVGRALLEAPVVEAIPIATTPVAPKKGQATLAFEPPAQERPPMFEALIKTKLFQLQLRELPEQDRAICQKAIELLIRRGGRMARDPFGEEMGIAMAGARVAGLVSKLERVLNVEAEPVVEHDAKSRLVTLDIQLLRAVFLEDGHG